METKPNPLETIRLVEQDNLDVAERLALSKLASLDIERQALRCGARLVDDGGQRHLSFDYIGTPLRVTTPEHLVYLPGGKELEQYERVLVLHYLSSDGPVLPEREPITFKEVPSGEFYSSAFDRRAKKPLVAVFGANPERAVPAAESIGGRLDRGGDVAVTIPAFPRIDITLVFYRADEEFGADVSLFMSSQITSYLSTEDIATLSGLTAYKLIRGAKK